MNELKICEMFCEVIGTFFRVGGESLDLFFKFFPNFKFWRKFEFIWGEGEVNERGEKSAKI